MSVIDVIIPPQSFELVRNRIGEILADELDNQVTLTYDTDLEVTVYLERFIDLDKTELPAINVTLDRGDYEQTTTQASGVYKYNIDCYVSAKSSEGVRGDSKARLKLHKLIGVCRYLLSDPKYKTLGYAPGFTMQKFIESIQISEVAQQDAISLAMGRLVLSVKLPESTTLINAPILDGYITNTKLEESDSGYIFTQSQ